MSDPKDDKDHQPSNKQKRISDKVINETKADILEVGYKRPPEHTRFKKGQSGNPKGRPWKNTLEFRGPGSAHDLVLQEAQRVIKVREDGELREMTTMQAVQRAQSASALKGNAFAQRHFIRQNVEAQQARLQAIEKDHELWRWYVDSRREAMAEAVSRGEIPPEELPHPDDVVFPEDDFVQFLGPCDDEQAKKVKRGCQLRDLLVMQDALERWERRDSATGDWRFEFGSAYLLADWLNKKLPPRLQLAAVEMASLAMRFDATPKRQLLKSLFHGWRAVGMPRRRGWMFPPGLKAGEKVVGLLSAVERLASTHNVNAANLLDRMSAVLESESRLVEQRDA